MFRMLPLASIIFILNLFYFIFCLMFPCHLRTESYEGTLVLAFSYLAHSGSY